MNSIQLEELFLLDSEIRKCYMGIYPIDEIPDVKNGKLVVVNLDPSYRPGSHWIVLYRRNDAYMEYFDSMGRKPKIDILTYLFAKNYKCVYNAKRIQDYNTNTCGLFCLFYAYYACRSCSFENIINCFTDNLKINEALVKKTNLYLQSKRNLYMTSTEV